MFLDPDTYHRPTCIIPATLVWVLLICWRLFSMVFIMGYSSDSTIIVINGIIELRWLLISLLFAFYPTMLTGDRVLQ